MKIDKFDRKLLYELDKNSRQSYNQIGKAIRRNKNSVRYRLEQLKKAGLIKNFLTIIDNSKLGYTQHKVFLRLQNLIANKKEEIINYLKNNPNITWLASCDGSYDLIFSVRVVSLKHFKKILMNFLNKYDNFVKERTVTSILEAEYLPRDYLLNKKRTIISKAIISSEEKASEIDESDLKILTFLAKDSRTPIINIAEELNLTATTIASRIKKLKKDKFIQRYSVVLDNSKLNQLHFKVLIGLHNITEEKQKLIFNYVRQNPNIFFIVNALGLWELEIDLEVENINKFRNIMMEITNKFSEIIKDYSSLQIYEVYKYEFFCKENISEIID